MPFNGIAPIYWYLNLLPILFSGFCKPDEYYKQDEYFDPMTGTCEPKTVIRDLGLELGIDAGTLLTSLNDSVGDIAEINVLQAEVSNNGGNIATLQTQVVNNSADITTNSEEIGNNAASILNLQTNVQTNMDRLTSNEVNIAGLVQGAV